MNRIIMRVVSGVSSVRRWLSPSQQQLPRQPLVHLFGIEGGVYCGGITMHSNTDWEMHPDGDETLTLLSGQIDVILDHGSQQEIVRLARGQSTCIPAGVWHRQVVHSEGQLLFMTPGDSTQHRAFQPVA